MSSRVTRVLEYFDRWSETFKANNSDYGSSYTLTGETLALWFPNGFTLDSAQKHVFYGLLIRMLDKLIHASNLVLASDGSALVNEKVDETMGDLVAYGFMPAEVIKYEE